MEGTKKELNERENGKIESSYRQTSLGLRECCVYRRVLFHTYCLVCPLFAQSGDDRCMFFTLFGVCVFFVWPGYRLVAAPVN